MINLRRAAVSGEYEGTRQDVRIVLRVDVGQEDFLDIISGDLFFETSQGTFQFHHSFQTTGLVLEDGEGQQILRGAVKVHREDILDIARLDLSIPDTGELLATYTFYKLTLFGRQNAATFSFPLVRRSDFLRRVELEIDQVQGIPLPQAFRPRSHPDTPADYPDRTLTPQSAYQEAGVDLVVTFGEETVPTGGAGLDGLWNDEELHAAMETHFEEHHDEPQWFLYVLLRHCFHVGGIDGSHISRRVSLHCSKPDSCPKRHGGVARRPRGASGSPSPWSCGHEEDMDSPVRRKAGRDIHL